MIRENLLLLEKKLFVVEADDGHKSVFLIRLDD